MSITNVGAIYATVSKLLQRVYVPSLSDAEISQQYVADGETLQNVSLAVFQKGGLVAVQAAIGVPSISGRCAIIDGTNVCIDVIIADPAIYADPNGNQLILSDLAAVGDTWVAAASQFQRRYAEYDTSTRVVNNISMQNIANPVVKTVGDALTASDTLQVGQVVPSATAA